MESTFLGLKQAICNKKLVGSLSNDDDHGSENVANTINLRASSPIWACETSLARTREPAAKPRGRRKGPSLVGSREARFAGPNRTACSQTITQCIFVPSNFIASVWTRSVCQMHAPFRGVVLLRTLSSFKTKKENPSRICLRMFTPSH